MARSSAARDPWLSLTLRTMHLAVDSHHVIGLRLMRLSMAGWHGPAEVGLMIEEKIDATIEAGWGAARALLRGDNPAAMADGVARVYHRRVAANKRRLSR